MFLLYLGKHQLYEYPAAVLQSLRPVGVLGQAGGGGGVVAGGHLGAVPHWAAAHCHRVTPSKVRSVHHHRHAVSQSIFLISN